MHIEGVFTMREELELFAHNLRVYMDTYGFTQTSLANELDVGVTTVNEWVHGRKFPRFGKISMLTELFHCTVGDLMENYTTEETIRRSEMEKRLVSYMSRLNSDGYEKALTFFEDLNPKFYIGEDNVQ